MVMKYFNPIFWTGWEGKELNRVLTETMGKISIKMALKFSWN